MAKGQFLGEFEQVVLLAVARLGKDAYGAAIRQEAEARAQREVAVGAIYATLDRLETKGYLTRRPGPTTVERGGRPKRHFTITPSGVLALEASRRMLDRMWEGVELPKGAS
jgi:PadR family transcriptional regulator